MFAIVWNIQHLYFYNQHLVFDLYFLPILFSTIFLNQKVGYVITGISALSFVLCGVFFNGLSMGIVFEGLLLLVANGLMVFLVGRVLKQRDEIVNKKIFLFDRIDSFVFGIDNEGKIDLCNKNMSELLGLQHNDEVIGEYFWKFEQEVNNKGLKEIFSYLHSDENQKEELEFEKDGQRRVFIVQTYFVEHDGFVGGKSVILYEITKRKVMEEKLKELATTDSLTNLYNRRYFEQKFHEEIARSERYNHPISLMVLDIDFFKKVNDTYGHTAGDEVLKKLSQILLENLRNTDVAARLGGEEFAVLLPETDKEDMLQIAERLLQHIRQTEIQVDGHVLSITSSIGVITINKDFQMKEMLERADAALYRAKENGRDQIQIA